MKNLLLFCLFGLVLIVAFVLLFVRHDVHGRVGSEIRYDDFDFKLVEARSATELAGVPRPQGVFWVVTLEVANHAVRVDYDASTHRPKLVDRAGNTYDVDAAATSALAAARGRSAVPPVLHPNQTWRSELVFDVPPQPGLELEITWGRGSSWIDLLDRSVFGTRRFALE